MTVAGYILCPCCGYDTVASDVTVPELCLECEEAGCELDGSDPQCTRDEEMSGAQEEST